MNISLIKKILWQLKWYLLIIPIVCAAITFVLLEFKPKQYISQAQIATGITDQEKVGITDNETNWNVLSNRFSNFLAFIESKEIISMVSYSLLINDLSNTNPYRKLNSESTEKIKLTNEEKIQILNILKQKYSSIQLLDNTIPQEKRILSIIKEYKYDIKALNKSLSVNRVLSSDFVKVEFKSESPKLSAFFVNKFCDELIRFNEFTETKKFGTSLSFLKELMDQKKKELELKMDTLRRFKESSNVVNFNLQSESKLNQISGLEQNRNEELKKISSLQSAISEIKRKIGASGSTAGEDVFQNNKVVKLQEKIQRLSEKNYASGSKNRIIEDSIQMLRAELENRIYLLSKNIDNSDVALQTKQDLISKKLNFEIELSMAKSNYAIIESLLNKLKSNINNIVVDEGKIASLELDINAAREEYIKVEDRYNKAKNISLNKGGSLRQIELGQPADQPESSHIMLFTALSYVLTLCIILGAGIGYTFLDSTIRTPDRFEDFTHFKCLGYLHKFPNKTTLKNIVDLLQNSSDNKQVLERELQNIRYELIKSRAQSVLFTSFEANQGKSFSIFTLAYSLSQNGSKVVIIDTNFKNNSLSMLFENYIFQNFMQKLEDGKLLNAENVSENADPYMPSTILFSNSDLIKKTGFENIDIIGSSSTHKSPFEIFNNKDFSRLLSALYESYDYVLLEGSALNLYSDSKELIDFVEKVILVTSADYSFTKKDKLSFKFINSLGDKFLGAILNKVEQSDLN